MLAEDLGPTAAVDAAVAHHACPCDPRAVDHGAATATGLRDDAATAGAHFVYQGIARAEQDSLRLHHQRHAGLEVERSGEERVADRKSTRLNSSHLGISYAVFCLKKKKKKDTTRSAPCNARRALSAWDTRIST